MPHLADPVSSSASRAQPPVDQAAGLRQMFATRALSFAPVVANGAAACGGLVLERLCTAYANLGLKTLVVDASEQARTPCELAEFDLAEGIEVLSNQVSYMPARGLPLRHVDAMGSCGALLDALAEAAPQHDVVLVHASASELVRLFAQRARGHDVRPLVLTNDLADGLKEAYASVKLISQRSHWRIYDLIVCAPPISRQARTVARRLGECADHFLGMAQRDWQELDLLAAAHSDITPTFQQLANEQLRHALPVQLGDAAFEHLVSPGAALPARRAPVLN